MEFVGKQKRRTFGRSRVDPENFWQHHNLQFYVFPPQETISLAELKHLASLRQKILNAVESAGLRYPQKQSDEYQRAVDGALRQLDFRIAVIPMSDFSSAEREKELKRGRRIDYLSHFILRLAYCSRHELRQWFIQQEVDLFKFRCANESTSSLKMFMQLYGIPCALITEDERKEIEPILRRMYDEELKDIFKVYFTDAVDLVRNRKVYLRRGHAYVPSREMTSVIIGRFRSNLSKALTMSSKYAPALSQDSRLAPVINLASLRGCTSSAYTPNSTANENVTADMIDKLAKESFPPCMRNMYDDLHAKHHLKNAGRLQLGLFLKGVGLSYEESMRFWKKEFAPKTDSTKFDKEYSYNVRHAYGKEGKRANYTPFSCPKMVMCAPPGPLDCHGCPFKHMDEPNLRQLLRKWTISSGDEEKIVKLAQGKQYDRACSRYFETRHNLPEGGINQLISHPNFYFDESRKMLTGEQKAIKNVPVITNAARVFISKAQQQEINDTVEDVNFFDDLQ